MLEGHRSEKREVMSEMILQDKGISDATALKMVRKLLAKHRSNTGFRLNTKNGTVTVTYDDLIQFVGILANKASCGEYGELRMCTTCGNFNRSGKYQHMGWCSPKEHTLTRKTTDHCSRWVPMTEQQKHTKERIDEHFGSLQTK